MKTTRRAFLSSATLGATALILSPRLVIAGQDPGVPSPATRGLLFDAGDLERMRQTVRHPRFAPYWVTLTGADTAGDRKFLRDELRLNNHVADMLKARIILERTSFVYALTKDPTQLDIAKLAVDRILEFKKWDYFQEGGSETFGLQRAPEATIAMSFAREWLDDALTDDVKKEMERQIAEKGAPACYRTLYGMKHPDRVRGWGFDPESDYSFRFDLSRWPIILNSTNLKVIPIAGLGIAACLLYGKHPSAERWLELARQSARAFAPMFGSDGSYEEGVSYWGYTALHFTLFLEVMYRKLGIDERDLINNSGTVRYALQMSMPTIGKPNDCINFGDASIIGDTSVAAWVARRYRDPIAQYVTTNVGEVRNHYPVVWFDATLDAKTPGSELYDVRFANDWVVSRTGWDERSSVVALRSGPPANHEHADRNSVIFTAYGERLLHDPFKAAYSYTLPHWVLRLTGAHNAVLINGKGHQYHDGHEGTNASWSEAKVVRYSHNEKHMVVTSDATEPYRLVNPDVDLVRRTVVFLKPDILFLFDRVRLKNQKSKVQLRFQVFNEDGKGIGKAEKSTFSIDRPQASLQGHIFSPLPFTLRAGKHAVPEDVGVYPFLEAECAESLDQKILSVCMAQSVGKKLGTVTSSNQGPLWTVKVNHNGRSITVRISAEEETPTIEIV